MSKESVLNAVRGALTTSHGAAPPAYPVEPAPRSAVTTDPDALCREFVQEFDKLAQYEDQRFGAAWRVASVDEARARVCALFAREDVRQVCASPSPLLNEVLSDALRQQVDFTLATTPETAGANLSTFDLGLTDCLCLCARTGSILASTAEMVSRAVSLLPPVHLVLARVGQLVPDIPDAIGLIASMPGFPDDLPAAYTFITGSSRTSDIEKVLVVPAHGPREVFVIILP